MVVGKIQKWGSSQGLRLSRQLLSQAEIEVGDDVEVVASEQQIVVRKRQHPKYDLAELVARIPKGYKAEEAATGPAVGREVW
ncbi:MAG: transcriptional regulator/antitoxin, MazE [Candidatus Saccharimonas sp.]|nr:transcriptional regulator/antitoxin, MazE [Planctomycetaceae bacterium]